MPRARSAGQQVGRTLSAMEQQAADALRRARRLPVGAHRNDVRQLATLMVPKGFRPSRAAGASSPDARRVDAERLREGVHAPIG